jgi:hypothetical protein
LDVAGGGEAVLRAGRNRGVVVAGLDGAAIALHVDRPCVVTVPGEELHDRGIRPPREVEIEGRLRRHRRAVDEQDDALRGCRIDRASVPHEQLHVAFFGPMRRTGVLVGSFIHDVFPGSVAVSWQWAAN